MSDLNMVFDSLKVIENEQLNPEGKERVRIRYLTSKYFQEGDHSELQKVVVESEIPEIYEKGGDKKAMEEGEDSAGLKIKYDTKPQPSLQDEFNLILGKFQQEKEEEDSRLKRLAAGEKDAGNEKASLETIKRYYNIDKIAKDIAQRRVNDLNLQFNRLYFPNDDDTIRPTPVLQQQLAMLKDPNAKFTQDKLKHKNTMPSYKMRSSKSPKSLFKKASNTPSRCTTSFSEPSSPPSSSAAATAAVYWVTSRNCCIGHRLIE